MSPPPLLINVYAKLAVGLLLGMVLQMPAHAVAQQGQLGLAVGDRVKVINPSGLNIRSGPGTSYGKTGSVGLNEKGSITTSGGSYYSLGATYGWYYISWDSNAAGWSAGYFINGVAYIEKITSTAPDWTVDNNVSVSDNTVDPGQSITISATARNSGTATAGSTTMRYLWSTDASITTSDEELCTDDVSSRSAGSTSAESQTCSVPSSVTAGRTYYVGACVDTLSSESSTSNNCSSGVAVTVNASTTAPDWTVDNNVSVSDNTVDPGQSITISATARNSGTATAGSTTMRYLWSTNASITTSDEELCTDNVPSRSAGGTSAESQSCSVPSSLTAGRTYYVGACVDTLSSESSTSNNCSSGVAVTVNASGNSNAPDLYLKIEDINNGRDSELAPGQDISIRLTVENIGSAQADAQTIAFYGVDEDVSETVFTPLADGATFVSTGLCTDALASLSVSGSIELHKDCRLPSSLQAGSSYVRACVGTATGETTTDNNCEILTVTIEDPIKQQTIKATLYNIAKAAVASNTAHDYNGYGHCPDPSDCSPTSSQTSGYYGGHSGIDFDYTNDNNRAFYSLTAGQVVAAGSQSYSEVAVYNATDDRTVLYLHANSIAVSVGNAVSVGTQLGTQGKAGVTGEHVHVEVRAGSAVVGSGGAGATVSPTNIDPINYLYDSIVNASTTAPDWTVDNNVSVSDNTVDPGQSITISATARNSGTATAGSTTMRYLWSTDASITTSDEELCTDDVSSRSAGSTSAESQTCSVPSSVTAGRTYYVGACVDTLSSESSTSNNCSSGVAVTVNASTTAPDWTVDNNVSVSDNTVDPGQSITISATARNSGTATAGSTTMRYLWSTNASITTSDEELCTDNVPSRSAGGTSAESQSCSVPSSLTAGRTYYVGACVDTLSSESSTSNNCSSGVAVTVNASGNSNAPDLYLKIEDINNGRDSELAPGQDISIRLTVENIGSAQADAQTIAFYGVDEDVSETVFTPLADGATFVSTGLCTDALASLSVSGSIELHKDCRLPSSLQAGSSYVRACVGTATGETTTDNNCEILTVTIEDPIKQQTIKATLYNIAKAAVASNTAHDYNGYGHCPDPSDCSPTSSQTSGYYGGHSGIDFDYTNDNNRAFYSLTAGQVVAAGSQSYSEVAVYNATDDRTVLYLHANSIAVSVGNAVSVGTQLGTQGKAGVTGEHVHVEVRAGSAVVGSGGAGATVSPTNIDPINYLYDSIVNASTTAPDWTVDNNVSVSDNTVDPGQSITISATARNSGTATAGSTTMRYLWSTDASITTSDEELCTDDVSSRSAGSTSAESQTCSVPSSVTAGRTYYVGACVDTLSSESSTSNNCSSGVAVTVNASTTAPDWTVDNNVSVSDNTVDPGQSITISATARNSGTATAGSTTMRYLWSTNASITTSDEELCTDNVPSRSAGGTSAESQSCSVPSSLTAGRTYYVGACVDTLSSESSTSNNCSSGVAVTINSAPDWTVDSVSVSDTTVDKGQSITISATARNSGTATAGSTTMRYLWSTDASITTSDEELCTDDVSSRSAGSTSAESQTCSVPSLVTAGTTYYVGACVDAVSGESSTSNNCSSGVAVTVNAPDWTVDTVSVTDNTVDPGQSITISATARNSGTATAGSTTMRYLWSTNASITTSDEELCTDNVPSRSAGGTSAESQTCSVPSSVTAGTTYYVGACVDTLSSESSTSNNCSSGVAVTINSAPDWTVDSVSVSDTTVDKGQSITISATARNSGTATAGSTTMRYLWSTNSSITASDTELCTDSVSSTSAGGTSAESQTCSVPSSLTAGTTYYVGACVDTLSSESSTSNNCSSGVAVTVNAPDWTVDTVSVTDNTVDPGQSITISATARNSGTATAGSTTMRYLWSTDATIATADTELCTDSVSSAPAGGTSLESQTCSVPSSVTAGTTYYVGACVDTLSDESSTSNNCSSGMAVTVNAPDWTVDDDVSVSDTIVDPGQSITISATARNSGTATAGSTTMRYRWSTDTTIATADTELCTDSVASTSAGGTSAESQTCSVPSSVTAGTAYYVGACVDALSSESSTSNNCSSGVAVAVHASGFMEMDVDLNGVVNQTDALMIFRALGFSDPIRQLIKDGTFPNVVVAGSPGLRHQETAIILRIEAHSGN